MISIQGTYGFGGQWSAQNLCDIGAVCQVGYYLNGNVRIELQQGSGYFLWDAGTNETTTVTVYLCPGNTTVGRVQIGTFTIRGQAQYYNLIQTTLYQQSVFMDKALYIQAVAASKPDKLKMVGQAMFRAVADQIPFTVSRYASPGAGGSLNGPGTAYYGEEVLLTPVPSTGYQFDHWENNAGLSISNNRFHMPAQNVTVTAVFTKINYAITKASSPSGAGTIAVKKNGSAVTQANYGDTITLEQTPGKGYYFNGWSSSPQVTISSNSFTMPASAITITANYLLRSTASLNKTTLEGGGTAALTIYPDKTTYSHKYKLSFGTGMESSWIDVAAGTNSVTVNIPLNWSAQIPNATSKANGTLTVKTYNGTTEIGSYAITGLTYSVPASVKPSVGTITASIARTIGGVTYANVGDYYVQNHCGVRIQASGSGSQSSTISSISVAISGYSGSNYSKTVNSGSIDFTSALLTVAGTATITVTVTDSRGRTNSSTTTITVSAYAKPSGTLTVQRVDANRDPDDMGTYGIYSLTKSYTAIGSNTLSWSLSYSGGSASSPGNSGDLLPNDRRTFPTTSEYNFTLTLTDAFETVLVTAKLPSARFILAFDSTGNKMGVMKYPNKAIPAGKSRTMEISAETQVYIGDNTLENYTSVYKKYLESGDDLNDLKTSGVYIISSGVANTPVSWAGLLVLGTGTWGFQIIVADAGIYTRAFTGNPAYWHSWKFYEGVVVT